MDLFLDAAPWLGSALGGWLAHKYVPALVIQGLAWASKKIGR